MYIYIYISNTLRTVHRSMICFWYPLCLSVFIKTHCSLLKALKAKFVRFCFPSVTCWMTRSLPLPRAFSDMLPLHFPTELQTTCCGVVFCFGILAFLSPFVVFLLLILFLKVLHYFSLDSTPVFIPFMWGLAIWACKRSMHTGSNFCSLGMVSMKWLEFHFLVFYFITFPAIMFSNFWEIKSISMAECLNFSDALYQQNENEHIWGAGWPSTHLFSLLQHKAVSFIHPILANNYCFGFFFLLL